MKPHASSELNVDGMNLEQLQKKLVAAARVQPPSDHVPYAFEKRIAARLRGGPRADVGTFWARALWRAAAPCVAISLALSAWTFLAPTPGAGDEDMAQVFEQTMLVTVEHAEETW